ncbi:ComEC/Rec2 family competence protein [Rubrolithibacter danxiaensis]|uniref:ComEC/Rec2 family competence protein n=1 Tax=Rubrolithibacter danxiaensis TaxID=3390805 RepID=UPI003BF895D0
MDRILKGEIPFVRILLPLIAGISVAIYSIPTLQLFKMMQHVQFLLLGLLFLFIVFYQRLSLFNYRGIAGFLFSLFIALSGYLLCVRQSEKLEVNHFSKLNPDFLIASISYEPKLTGDILRFEVKVKQVLNKNQFQKSKGNLLVALKTDTLLNQKYQYGDLLLIPSKYKEIDPPYNPFEFDFKKYLGYRSVYYQAFINEQQIRLIGHHTGNPVIEYAINLRQKLVERFNKHIADKNAAAVASTLILGYKADLTQEVLNAYSQTGTMHVLSVSGMHVGIVFIVIAFLLRPLDKNKRLRILKAFILLIFIWTYATITGFSSAVCRAAIMLSFVIIGKAVNKHTNSYNLISISAVLLLIYNPFYLVEVGFQLSYLAVLGLIYLYPKIYQLLYVKNYFFDQIWSYTALSIAAQLATFPLSLYYFHQFPLYFLISNLLIVIPVALIMYAGLVFVLLPFGLIESSLGWFLNHSIVFTNKLLFTVEHLPFSVLNKIWINSFQYLLIYAIVFSLFYFIIYKKKAAIWHTSFFMLIFSLTHINTRLVKIKEKKVVFYTLRKSSAVGFIEGNHMFLLTGLTSADKTFTFSVKPSTEEQGIGELTMIKTGQKIISSNFYLEGNFIQFRNWKMAIWDKNFDKKHYSEKMVLSAVLISGNPRVNINRIKNTFNFPTLLIDGTNSDYNIKRWSAQAKKLNLKYYILKRNPAYITDI